MTRPSSVARSLTLEHIKTPVWDFHDSICQVFITAFSFFQITPERQIQSFHRCLVKQAMWHPTCEILLNNKKEEENIGTHQWLKKKKTRLSQNIALHNSICTGFLKLKQTFNRHWSNDCRGGGLRESGCICLMIPQETPTITTFRMQIQLLLNNHLCAH